MELPWWSIVGLCVSLAGGMGLIPGWATKIPHATQHGQNHTHTQKLTHETQQQTIQ